MRCGMSLLTFWILFASPATVLPDASQSRDCREHGRGIRVCTELDRSALSRPGASTRLRVWVEGGPRPIQIRLHNDSPGVVRLQGGNDQIVHLGCLLHRQVLRKVTTIGPGEPQLAVRPYSALPKREAADIAAVLAPRLAEIEARFIKRRAELPPGYTSEAVSALLNTTEAELLDALSYQELAALRDFVQEEFRKARVNLGETRIGRKKDRIRPSFPIQVVLASLSGSRLPQDTRSGRSSGAVSRSNPNPVLDRVADDLHLVKRMAEQDELLVSICVTSEPGDGVKVSLRPLSIRVWTVETVTIGELPTLYRGIYLYKASRSLKAGASCVNPLKQGCSPLDLVRHPLPALYCQLSARACTLRPGPLPGNDCRNHGS